MSKNYSRKQAKPSTFLYSIIKQKNTKKLLRTDFYGNEEGNEHRKHWNINIFMERVGDEAADGEVQNSSQGGCAAAHQGSSCEY